PTSSNPSETIFGFVDSSLDGWLTPIDALLIINRLNKAGGEGESDPVPARLRATDLALAQLAADDLDRRKRSRLAPQNS
ncbi:MAG: hypothetical protein KDA51_09690, partial [Planctomycetales bacterium]|nr:hypothetical protein [Planctomycetales bacterium]